MECGVYRDVIISCPKPYSIYLIGTIGLDCDVVVSQNRGAQYRPPNTIILNIGTPKMVPLILGNSHVHQFENALYGRNWHLGVRVKGGGKHLWLKLIGYILGLYWDNGKENGNYYSIIGYIFGLYWDNGKENGNYYSIIGYILGLYWDNGKENGNYQSIIGYILGLYWDNGKENGNYYMIIGYILGLYMFFESSTVSWVQRFGRSMYRVSRTRNF